MSDKTTFNFRIDRATIERFKQNVKSQDTTATELLTKWINQFNAECDQDSTDEKTAQTVSANNQTTDIVKSSDALTDKINELWETINQQQREIEKLQHLQQRQHRQQHKINNQQQYSTDSTDALTKRIETLESGKIDRADFDGLFCNYSTDSTDNADKDTTAPQPLKKEKSPNDGEAEGLGGDSSGESKQTQHSDGATDSNDSTASESEETAPPPQSLESSTNSTDTALTEESESAIADLPSPITNSSLAAAYGISEGGLRLWRKNPPIAGKKPIWDKIIKDWEYNPSIKKWEKRNK